MAMCVQLVVLLQARCRLLEPLHLVGLDPVVAGEVALIWRVSVGIEEVDGERRMVGGSTGEDLDVVVADTVDIGRASRGHGVRKCLHERHLGFTGHGFLVIMVAEDGSIGDLAINENLGDLEDGLKHVSNSVGNK